jgi:hypothetical protein
VNHISVLLGIPFMGPDPKLPPIAPQFPFVARDHDLNKTYGTGFSISELMMKNSVGMMSKRDHIAYADNHSETRLSP